VNSRLATTAMITLAVAGLVGVASSSGASTAPPRWALHGAYSPRIRPANFGDKIDNRYFPLAPGTAFHYRGYSGKTAQTDDMVVTRETKLSRGDRVQCRANYTPTTQALPGGSRS
jgi:hypothetical protein